MKVSIELLPAEKVALTVALSQALRGAEITPNVAQMCVLALARVTGRHDWTNDERPGESMPLAETR